MSERPWYLDRDTDAADLDGSPVAYADGSTYDTRAAALGITGDLGTHAEQRRALGRDVPEMPERDPD